MTRAMKPITQISGEVNLPGDKSISHRALMISAIADGESYLENLNPGDDVSRTMTCLRELGVKIEQKDHSTVVYGKGLTGLDAPDKTLDVGNSGTTIRLLSGILAGQPFRSKITGDESIRSRPMARIVAPLRQMGADVIATRHEHAPLSIKGGNLKPIEYQLPVASAQVKSCLLLAGLYAAGRSVIIEQSVTRDHTELMLVRFGAHLRKEQHRISVFGPATLEAQEIFIPGDMSSAAYFIAAASLCPNSELLIRNVGINPTRKIFISLLCDMGANVELVNVHSVGNELMADIYVRSAELKPFNIGGQVVPQIIDEIPVLALMATQARGRSEIRDAAELRVKESDRLRSLAFNLERMGARVKEQEGGLIIEGPTKLRGADIETFGDHRIAMTFAVSAILADGETKLRGAECADISFPGFFDLLHNLAAE